jgi:hypothetical protein
MERDLRIEELNQELSNLEKRYLDDIAKANK